MSSIMEQLLESSSSFYEGTDEADSEFGDKTTSSGSSSSPSPSSVKDECDTPSNKGTKWQDANESYDYGLTESEMLTADELFNIYSEAVVEVLRESKKAITAKYNEKKAIAKRFKAKKLADKSKAAKKQKLEEAAISGGFNSVMEQILDAR